MMLFIAGALVGVAIGLIGFLVIDLNSGKEFEGAMEKAKADMDELAERTWKKHNTRWEQKEVAPDALVWVCGQCGFTTQFKCDGPRDNGYNYCPECGRVITEFVRRKGEAERRAQD